MEDISLSLQLGCEQQVLIQECYAARLRKPGGKQTREKENLLKSNVDPNKQDDEGIEIFSSVDVFVFMFVSNMS